MTMQAVADSFAVFQDCAKATDVKIHRITCPTYVNRDPTASTVKWHTSPTLQGAVQIAKRLASEHGMRYRDCQLCKIDRFAISRDLWKASEIRIHIIDCKWYVNRKPDATTMEWCAVPDYQDARTVAKRFSDEDGIGYGDCASCKPSELEALDDSKPLYMDARQRCSMCGKYIRGVMETEGGTYRAFNIEDNTPHKHVRIATSSILAAKHYASSEDKSKKVGDMTLGELEKRISSISAKSAAMKMGTYLHAQHGYPDRGFEKNFFKRAITAGGSEYYITAKLDDVKEGVMFEAKFIESKQTFSKNLEYARDQCDIYGWIAGLARCKIIIHVISSNETIEINHGSNHCNGERLVREYVAGLSPGPAGGAR